jgi:hypothetical protein
MSVVSPQRVTREDLSRENVAIMSKSESNVVFEVTDLLTGEHYSVKDEGSYYQLQFPTRAGHEVKVAKEADSTIVAAKILDQPPL